MFLLQNQTNKKNHYLCSPPRSKIQAWHQVSVVANYLSTTTSKPASKHILRKLLLFQAHSTRASPLRVQTSSHFRVQQGITNKLAPLPIK